MKYEYRALGRLTGHYYVSYTTALRLLLLQVAGRVVF